MTNIWRVDPGPDLYRIGFWSRVKKFLTFSKICENESDWEGFDWDDLQRRRQDHDESHHDRDEP